METEKTLYDYLVERMPTKHDYSFIDEATFKSLLETLVAAEADYIESIPSNDDDTVDYDDDAAFEFITARLNEKFAALATYINAITDDFLEVSEEYMTDTGNIDWD